MDVALTAPIPRPRGPRAPGSMGPGAPGPMGPGAPGPVDPSPLGPRVPRHLGPGAQGAPGPVCPRAHVPRDTGADEPTDSWAFRALGPRPCRYGRPLEMDVELRSLSRVPPFIPYPPRTPTLPTPLPPPIYMLPVLVCAALHGLSSLS